MIDFTLAVFNLVLYASIMAYAIHLGLIVAWSAYSKTWDKWIAMLVLLPFFCG